MKYAENSPISSESRMEAGSILRDRQAENSQDGPRTAHTLAERIRKCAALVGSGDELARRTGIPRRTLESYMTGDSEPKASRIVAIAQAADVSVDWLVTGKPPVHTAERIGQFVEATDRKSSVPVVGLAECGLKGWYLGAPMAVSALRPADLADAGAFAVIAIGGSMRPAGISQGFLCFCAPAIAPDRDDRVYIERADGTASIKIYLGHDETWLQLRGWLDPDEADRQEPYDERLRLDGVARLVPVIYIKLKL